jgi:putative oxidoreductase
MKKFKWLAICALSIFFLVAGGLKLLEPVEFAQAILRYQLVEGHLAWAGALMVPWMEVVAAIGLLNSRWRSAACWLLLGLLCFFEVILLSALFRGLDIDCGCLGTNATSSVSFALMRNILLIAVLLSVWKTDTAKSE